MHGVEIYFVGFFAIDRVWQKAAMKDRKINLKKKDQDDYSNYRIRTNQMEEKGATAHWFVQRYIWSKTWREDQKALKPSKLPTPIVATSLQRMVLELNYMPGPPENY